ncbi:ROK family transcriptional regulator [Demequina sp. NBRC 110056]|uniref:ROK family transcriptional regulator n=1 Tax=Demequina sp. NBRC 110056 TaxID=1570345 RepID=UPI0013564F4D|nr:ROK family transcriptional regulator [Demequina sp. NBRC 110056]
MVDRTRGRIFAALLRLRPASRKRLALATGASPATVTRAVDALMTEGLVVEVAEVAADRRGRREVLLDVAPGAGLAVGIDLGASRTRAVAVDATGTARATADVPTPATLGPAELARWLQDIAEEVGDRARDAGAVPGGARPSPAPRGLALAVGLPGAVAAAASDPATGAVRRISNAANLRQVEDPAFLEALEAGSGGALVAVDNDANLALVGEQHAGAAADATSAAMVTLGAGLGVGLAVDGAIVRGRRGLVGEFGQIPAGPEGLTLEALVTGPGLLARAVAAGIALDDPAAVFRPGPAAALRADFDRALTTVLAAVAVASDPDVIVLGGGIAKSLTGDLARYEEALAATLTVAPRVVATELGDLAGAAGAAVTALHGLYAGWGADPSALAGAPAPGTLTREALDAL